jgi:hypothetical protein
MPRLVTWGAGKLSFEGFSCHLKLLQVRFEKEDHPSVISNINGK